MDIFKDSALSRLAVVETGRRRRWTVAEKLRIVEESFVEPHCASATARRYGISNSLLFSWRKAYGADRRRSGEGASSFVPARIVSDPTPPMESRASGIGRMMIALVGGITITVDADVDAGALRRVLDVVNGRPVCRSLGEDR